MWGSFLFLEHVQLRNEATQVVIRHR